MEVCLGVHCSTSFVRLASNTMTARDTANTKQRSLRIHSGCWLRTDIIHEKWHSKIYSDLGKMILFMKIRNKEFVYIWQNKRKNNPRKIEHYCNKSADINHLLFQFNQRHRCIKKSDCLCMWHPMTISRNTSALVKHCTPGGNIKVRKSFVSTKGKVKVTRPLNLYPVKGQQ